MSIPIASSSEREGEESLSKQTVFDILSNERRRYVLHHLLSKDGEADLRDLSLQVAAWENELEPDDVSRQQRKRVYATLRQTHLPRMAEAGIIEYDEDRSIATVTSQVEDIELYLDVVPKRELSRSEFYLGLSAAATALLAAVWIGAYPFVLLPDVVWMAVVVLAFLLSAAVDTYFARYRRLGSRGSPPGADR